MDARRDQERRANTEVLA
ncbi:hypothetical protein BN1723_000152 [Verticillium longisporum]|uniref:Uncharacterized protein n=1 Tax=Verticillium longisporum TaxID=100787 RepID=A0A0G4KEY0_VERLO|nr:hypothetical protein BN1723_000152 [Verticillium longisporum]